MAKTQDQKAQTPSENPPAPNPQAPQTIVETPWEEQVKSKAQERLAKRREESKTQATTNADTITASMSSTSADSFSLERTK